MTLIDLVPTLDLCQQLKAAGFPQDTALAWYPEHCDDYEAIAPASLWPDEWKRIAEGIPVVCVREEMEDHESLCAAPTAGELEEWLLCNDCDNILVTNETAGGENAVGISCIHSDGRDFEAHEETEIEAKAALVLEVAG